MPRITLRNHKVHYQQTGDGPDVLLIHGLSCHIACWWFHVAPELAKTHRVTAIDLRGHGFSGMTETGYRAVDLAADVGALLDHLEMSRVHLVAHSFGGAVAAALATERQDIVSELTLADGWIPSLQPVPPFPSAREWAATIARAHARGIAVDRNLPLVVRGLYTELLDEGEFEAEGRPSDTDAAWEDRRDGGGQRGLGQLWRGSRLGRAFRPGAGAGGRSGFGAPVLGRFGRKDAEPRVSPTKDMQDAQLSDAGNGALKGALAMTGAPGRPSHAVRRWHELMRRTNARTEYLDTSAIEPAALKDLSIPLHLVYGARSQYRQSAERLQELVPQAELTIVPKAGHYFPLLRPQALVDAFVAAESAAVAGEGKPKLQLVSTRDDPQVSAGPTDETTSARSISGAPKV